MILNRLTTGFKKSGNVDSSLDSASYILGFYGLGSFVTLFHRRVPATRRADGIRCGPVSPLPVARRPVGVAETARELAYRLYAVAERKNRAAEALSYNALVQSWPEVARLARQEAPAEQGGLFGDGDPGGAV